MVTVRLSFQLYLLIYAWTADGYACVHWRQLKRGTCAAGFAPVVPLEERRPHGREQSDHRGRVCLSSKGMSRIDRRGSVRDSTMMTWGVG
jgi:hypothetical protein